MISNALIVWFAAVLPREAAPQVAIATVLAAFVAAGILLHFAAFASLGRLIKPDGMGARIVRRIKGPTLLAAILLAIVAALPAASLDPEVAEVLRRALKIGMISLLGWSAIIVINKAADYGIGRHPIDVEDNLVARKMRTQFDLLRRAAVMLAVAMTFAAILMAFPSVRQYGISLFASAGVAGIVIGLAARPVLANLIAGVQIALTQPIRIDDVVVVQGEWGVIEEVTTTYVVIRIWDWRRLIVPLAHFIEKPFENWTRESASIIGTVTWYVDHGAPFERMRGELERMLAASDLWDGQVCNFQVVETTERTVQVRALMSARNSQRAWDLRCHVREAMVAWLQREAPHALPRGREEYLPLPRPHLAVAA